MFSGIVRDIGRIKFIRGGTMMIESRLKGLEAGSSLMVDGVCLTLTALNGSDLSLDTGVETLEKTSLGSLRTGSAVNLEPALKLIDRIDGHIVYGHVFGTGRVLSLKHKNNTIIISVKTSDRIIGALMEKGSMAVNGVSLTVNEINGKTFTVGVVPETVRRTTLGKLSSNSIVNIEPDMLIAAAKGN